MSDQNGSLPDQGASLERLEGILFEPEEPEATEGEPEETTQDETDEPQSEEEADDGAVEGDDLAEPEPEPKRHRVKVNGKEYDVSEQELVNGYQRNEDYVTRNEALKREQEAFKQAQEQFQRAQQVHQMTQQELAQAMAVDSQLAQYAQLDWQKLYDEDPASAAKLDHQYRMLENQRQQAYLRVQQAQQMVGHEAQRQFAERLEVAKQEVPKIVPGFNAQVDTELRQFVESLGFERTAVTQAIVDNPMAAKIIWMANEYSKLQNKKPMVNKKVSNAPIPVKPGNQVSSKANSQSKDNDLRQKLKKTGRIDDAANLFMHRFLKE